VTETVLTPERILETAEDVLRRFGPAKATVVDVARALDVSHGSVYRHFASKAALRDAVAERWLARISDPLRLPPRDAPVTWALGTTPIATKQGSTGSKLFRHRTGSVVQHPVGPVKAVSKQWATASTLDARAPSRTRYARSGTGYLRDIRRLSRDSTSRYRFRTSALTCGFALVVPTGFEPVSPP